MKIGTFILFLLIVSCNSGSEVIPNPSIKRDQKIIATVDYSSYGCFHGYEQKLVIFSDTTASLKFKDGSIIFERLTDSKLNSFYEFVKELKGKKFGVGCTTTDNYSVEIGKEKFQKTDGSCDYDGFTTLSRALFDKVDNLYNKNGY